MLITCCSQDFQVEKSGIFTPVHSKVGTVSSFLSYGGQGETSSRYLKLRRRETELCSSEKKSVVEGNRRRRRTRRLTLGDQNRRQGDNAQLGLVLLILKHDSLICRITFY